jgi:tetratricopeptide (TPR) repeat protein
MSEPDGADIRQVRLQIRNRNFSDALEGLQNLLKDFPDSSELLELQGKVQFLLRQPEAARDTFSLLTQVDPLNASGWINLGAVLNQIGEHKKAADALRRGLQRDRNNPEAYFNLGIAQKNLKMTSMAITAFREAIRIKPSMIDAHLCLGTIYSETNSHALAQQCFNNALKQDPENKKARTLLENSQSVQKAGRQSYSPFGRLVNLDELPQNQDAESARKLTPAERRTERELVRSLTKEMRQDAKGIPLFLTDRIQQSIHQLQVAVLHSSERIARPELHQNFMEAMESLRSLRTSVATGVAELRTHLEESEQREKR